MTRTIKNLLPVQESQVQTLGQKDPLEKSMASGSSMLAWRIPGTEGPGGLQSIWSQESHTAEQLNTSHFPYFPSSLLNKCKAEIYKKKKAISSIFGFRGKAVAQMVKRLPAMWGTRFNPWVGKIPWRRKWQPTPVFLPGKSHGWRSLTGYSPRGPKDSDMTEQLHFQAKIVMVP